MISRASSTNPVSLASTIEFGTQKMAKESPKFAADTADELLAEARKKNKE